MQGLQRVVNDEPDAHGRRQVGHDFANPGQFQHGQPVEDRVVDEVELVVIHQGFDVVKVSGGEVVDHVDLVPALQICFRQV